MKLGDLIHGSGGELLKVVRTIDVNTYEVKVINKTYMKDLVANSAVGATFSNSMTLVKATANWIKSFLGGHNNDRKI